MRCRSSHRLVSLAVAVASVGLLALGIARNAWPWIVDDAFISLRFAERLVDGAGLTWTDGECVEGYSNLSWVLATALLGWAGCEWIAAVRGLGIACTVATFVVLLAGGLLPRNLPGKLAVAVLAALGATSVWAIGGLEAPLMMLLVVAAMAGLQRALSVPPERAAAPLLATGAVLALLCWTRPDGPLWSAVAVGVVLACARGANAPCGSILRASALLLALPVAAVLLQLGFRVAYYGDWVPNTGRAKAMTTAESRRAGLDYVTSAAVAMRALLVPAALGVVGLWSARTRAVTAFALAGTLMWWAYVAAVGGDSFPRSRLLVPTLGPLAVLAAQGFGVVAAQGRRRWFVTLLAVIVAVVVARRDAERPTDDPRQRLPQWEWLGVATGEWLRDAFTARQPLIAVDAAGGVPFASRLPALDMLGLCDRTIATTPRADDGAFVPGHARANGAYVLSRRPDLVLFGLPPGAPQPQWRGGIEMEASEGFRRDYRVVLFHTGERRLGDGTRRDLRITAWTRLDGRLGVETAPDRVRIPGYWLGSYRQPYSFHEALRTGGPDVLASVQRDVQAGADWWIAAGVVGVLRSAGEVVGEVRRDGRHVLPRLPLAPGTWRVRASCPDGVRWELCAPGGGSLERHGDAFAVIGAAGDRVETDVVCVVPATVALPFVVERIDLEIVR